MTAQNPDRTHRLELARAAGVADPDSLSDADLELALRAANEQATERSREQQNDSGVAGA